MSLHKLTAGDGYTYLTRQVAAVAHAEGFDVSSELASLLQTHPLWATSPAVDLRYRVIAASHVTPVHDVPPPLPLLSALARTAIDHPSYGLGQVPGGPSPRGTSPPRR
jgi:hypothetical protein